MAQPGMTSAAGLDLRFFEVLAPWLAKLLCSQSLWAIVDIPRG